jgi:hypothetical protein
LCELCVGSWKETQDNFRLKSGENFLVAGAIDNKIDAADYDFGDVGIARVDLLNIWDLANDTEKLTAYDNEGIYGYPIYGKLRKGLIYVFKINTSGQVYPEIVPDI